MKVIRTDNYDREHRSDMLISGPGLAPIEAMEMAEKLNATRAPEDWYRAVKDDATLYEFKP